VPHLRLDTSRYPLVILEVDGKYTEQEASEFCEEMRSILEQRRRYALVVDVRSTAMPSLKTRGLLRKFIEETMKLSDAYTVGAGVVVQSAIVKMAVSALFHLRNGVFPLKALRTRDEAILWAMDQLERDQGMHGDNSLHQGDTLYMEGDA